MVRILYFGVARDLAQRNEESLDFSGLNVGEIWERLLQLHPILRDIRPICRVAVDMRYASNETPVSSGSEVAIIPPVAGG